MGLIDRIAGKAGVEVSAAPTEDDERRERRHTNIVMAWKWLRDQLDRDIQHYFETGSTEELEKHCVPPALDRLIAQLEVLHSQGKRWRQPERQLRTNFQVEVIDEELDAQRRVPTMFVIQETFTDRSVLETSTGPIEGEGERRTFKATVLCPGPTDFKLRDVRQVSVGG